MESQGSKVSIYKRALEITWLAVIFLIPLFFNPLSHQAFYLNKALLLQFLVMAMLAFWVADWILSRSSQKGLKRQSISISPLHLAISVFGLLAVLATAASITPAISFWGSYYRKAGLLTLVCWILFFLIVAQQLRNRAQLFRAIYTLLLSSGIVSVVGIIQHFFPSIIFNLKYIDRVFSTSGNALSISSFLSMVIPFNLALIIYSWSKRKEGKNTTILIGLVIVLGLQFWCLWLAQYSITILLFIVAPITFIILLGIVKGKKLLLGFGAASLLVLAIIAALLLSPLLLPGANVKAPEDLSSKLSMNAEELGLKTLDWRVQYWRSSINIVTKSPEVPFSNDRLHDFRKLIGYGPETFIVTFQLFFPDKLKGDYSYLSFLVDRPHNHYLYLATTLGLLGLMSFLSILAVFFYLCFRYLRRATADIYKLLLIAMMAGITQYMVDIFFNISTISPELVFWLMMAMIPVIGRFNRNEKPVSDEFEEVNQTEISAPSHVTRARLIVSVGCAITLIIIGMGITIRPFLADMYLQKGLNLQKVGSDQAIYAFDTATRLDSGESAYWHYLGAYDYSVARGVTEEPLKEEMLTLATDAYNKSLALRPYIALEYYSLADVYTYWAEAGNNDKWPMALSLYDKASQLLPRNAILLNMWSLALIIKGDFSQAQTKLDYAASIDPDWAETSFLSGLLLVREGKSSEAALKIIAPIEDDPDNLDSFIDLCYRLMVYDMISPLKDTLETRAKEVPDDWIAHALLGITGMFGDNLDKTLGEFNTAMMLVPGNNAGDLFRAILRLSYMSEPLKTALPSVAADWKAKLIQSPERDTLLPELDKLIDQSAWHFL